MTFMGGIKTERNRTVGYREQQVVAFVLRYYLDHCRKPTLDQIMEGVGLESKGEVSRIIGRIERGGLVTGLRGWRKGANDEPPDPVINGCPK